MSPVNLQEVARIILEDRADAFLELMARELNIPPEDFPRVRARLEKIHDELHRTLVRQLKDALKDKRLDTILTPSQADGPGVEEVRQELLKDLLPQLAVPPSPLPLTPELRAWALSQDTEEEILAGLREAREAAEQNGPELKDVVRKLEQEFRDRERARNPWRGAGFDGCCP